MQKILKLGYDISQKEKGNEEKEMVDFREEKLPIEKSDEGRIKKKELKKGRKKKREESREVERKEGFIRGKGGEAIKARTQGEK